MRKPALMRIVLAVYVLILAGIIFVAGNKGTRYLLSFIGSVPYGDKIGHFLLMGGLSFLVNFVLNARTVGFSMVRYLLGSLIVFVIVTIEEISQIFVRGRTFDWGDLAADILGIVVFGEIARSLCRRP